MNLIRATISFPYDVHEDLREEAFRTRSSLSQVVVNKLKPRQRVSSIQERILADMKFFADLAKKGKIEVEVTEAVREFRNQRLEKIAGAAGL
jgi:hypothetical protein